MSRVVYGLALIAVLHPWVSSPIALVLGVTLALTLGNPYLDETRKCTTPLLQFSIIGMGAAMDLMTVARAGLNGFAYTVVGIALILAVGTGLGRLLKTDRDVSLLISSGTAICGGSAIAAVSATIRAQPAQVAISLATVFLLNSLALLIFPWVGHQVGLDPTQFGLWSALAIHDTSSVVGASLQYGGEALAVAIPVKLARALWIIPLAAGVAYWRGSQSKGAKKPWFIGGFVLAAALVTAFPALKPAGEWVAFAARRGFVLTLFLIGSSLTPATLKSVGFRPTLQGVVLWVLTAVGSLAAIGLGWARV